MTKVTGVIEMTFLSGHNDFNKETKKWDKISVQLHAPKNDEEYETLTQYLDFLLDKISDDEDHRLMWLVDYITYMVIEYDNTHFDNELKGTGIDALKYLMSQHSLKQSDMKEIGSQGVVSEILSGKRELNVTQIKALAKRFNVSVNTFFD